ncbi:MAG: pantetheine-phosphate adenylyltransferase [Clostridia bacterium]|jgi:pantetheine-phosphate adenylyltransferase|nr:pantetheine-phosphate adenylyltransferase [Clostridia bacterium]MBT7122082.1 pantetheine-phosphate adenylyltransferase [Clostridia bacterium]
MSKCVYAGSFDPITSGHLDIIERAAARFGEVTIVVPVNIEKKCAFSLEQRLAMIQKSTAHIGGVSVNSVDGLLVDYMKQIGADLIIRGLRSLSDFDHEYQLASVNAKLYDDIETVFLMANPRYSFVSSSIVRELIFHGGDIDGFVPGIIIGDIKKYIGG